MKTVSGLFQERKLLPLSPCDLVAVLLCILIVLFPKGGVKVGNVPFTWGYLLLGMTGLIACPWALASGAVLRTSPLAFLAMLAALPFQITLLYAILAQGVSDWGYAISDITNFAILPMVMLVVFKPWYTKLNWPVLLGVLRICILAAAVYGIILFCAALLTGRMLEIPYLTTNAGDYGTLATEKYNSRGGIFKLVSTYNNGNVYGIATVLLMPLFDCLETRLWRRAILRIALVLTLSRTVWIALLLDQVFTLCARLWANFRHFPIIQLKGLLKPVVYMLPIIGLLLIGLQVMSRDFDFLLDPTFGGRIEQFRAFGTFTIFPAIPVADIEEVVYASVLKSLGMIGFLSVVLLLGSPVLVVLVNKSLLQNPIRAAALKGLLLYAAIAWADGAINYIPVMAFYWFILQILIYGGNVNVARDESV